MVAIVIRSRSVTRIGAMPTGRGPPGVAYGVLPDDLYKSGAPGSSTVAGMVNTP